MIGSIDPLNLIWIVPVILAVVAAIVITTVLAMRKRHTRSAVLQSDRPGALTNGRPPRRRSGPARITVHGDRLAVFDDEHASSATLGAAGVEVQSAAAAAALPWDRFCDARTPDAGTWAVRDDVIDAFIVAMVVTWTHGASVRPDATGALEVSLSGNWADADWACFHALLRLQAGRPDLRPPLDDPAVAERIAHDILVFNPVLPAQSFGSVRRRTVEIETAMKHAGFVHELARPLPGWPIPPLDGAVTALRDRLTANPLASGITVDDAEIIEHVRLNYLDTDPWPFGALFGL